MADTYCGKDCMSCDSREKLNCPGCKRGPGRTIWGDCALAKCCCDKGHETCETCGHNAGCFTYRDRDAAPFRRMMKAEQNAQQAAKLNQRAQLMGKWLKYMFRFSICGLIFNLLTMDFLKEAMPALGVIGVCGDFAASVLMGYCLLQLQGLSDRYRVAGLGVIGLTIFNGVYELMQSNINMRGIAIVFGVIGVGFGIVYKYNEIHAHSEMLVGIHDELSQKWLKLWKWIVVLYASVFGSIVLISLPVLALLVLLVSAVCSIAVSIYEMVYLYHTYKACEDHISNQ